MSSTEAREVGIDEVDRRLHFRINKGKANMVPPSASSWFKFVSVDLPNTDNVGVVTQWTYPETAKIEVPDAICTQLQREVGAGEYRANAQSPAWIGKLVARLFSIDLGKKGGRPAVGRLLEALYNKGVITTASGVTSGHGVTVVVAGPWSTT
jgi:hypothetical protein